MIGIRRNQLFVFLKTFLFALSAFSISAQNCTTTALNNAGDQIIFNGVSYEETPNGCTSTWSYCLKAGPGNPEISHFMIANDTCLECFDGESDIIEASHPIEVGTDPTTGKCGIKFDFGISVYEEICFSFTLGGAFETGERLFVTKAGQNVHAISICGPVCSTLTCENENPPPPIEEETPPTPEVDCPTIAYNDAGDAITFVGVEYNPNGTECTSTWNYCLTAGPGNPEISHFMIASPNCLTCLDSEADILEASHPFEMGTDPTTGQCGIKFDFGLNVNEEICFSFTLKGAFTVAEQLFVTKAGQNVHTVAICGPECTEVPCEEEGEMEELDCTDVVTSRPVINTNDNCGDWCNEYVFTLGNGNCYQAGNDLYFTEYNNGTATLKGSVVQGTAIGYLEVLFTGRTSLAPTGSPKYMLCVHNGGEFWQYYPEFTGTFTYPDGSTTSISRRGPAFQLGYGANVQDFEYGASGWFDCSNGDSGDMNFQLGNPEFCEAVEVFLEVECAEIGSLFETYQDPDASNGDYVTVQPNNNALNAAPESAESRIRFHLDLTAAGSYFLFARVKTPSSSDDSFWVRVNGGTWVKWNGIPQSNTFAWAQVHDNTNNNTPLSFFLEAGPNTIDFAYREDGAMLDKIFIGQSQNPPVGIGAEATNCICQDVLLLTCTPTNENCDFSNTPGINLEVSGATSTLNYLWSNGATSQNLENISAGTYSVTVTTQNGCSATCSTTIEDYTPISIECSVSNANCGTSDGFIYTQVWQGTAPFQYLWSNGATSANLNNLSAGTYSVTVTDANGCQASCSASIEATPPLTVSCTAQSNNCAGSANASISTFISGGSGPYTFLWSNGATTSEIGNLTSGIYEVTVTDSNGCMASCETEILIYPTLEISCSYIDFVCSAPNFANLLSNATGGDGNYTFEWSNGTTTQNQEYALADVYTVTVTDGQGCTASCTVEIPNTDQLLVECITETNPCEANSPNAISVIVSGGVAPYTYFWSNGSTASNLQNMDPATYTVTVTDALGCFTTCESTIEENNAPEISCSVSNDNCGTSDGFIYTQVWQGTAPFQYLWSNGATSANLDHLSAGTYSVTVTDANGCQASCSASIEATPPLTVSCTAQSNNCAGSANASISTFISGGSGPYTFLWSNGATTSEIGNLNSGIYTVTVTDSNGCVASCETEIINYPTLEINCSYVDFVCSAPNFANLLSNATGGDGNYTFAWSNGATTQNQEYALADVYTVTVTDGQGCTASCTVEIPNTDQLLVECITETNPCEANSPNAISVIVSGGVAPYTYFWSNGSTASNLQNMAAGTYTVTVTDALGCLASCEATIELFSSLTAVCEANTLDCTGENTGSVNVNVSGGLAPYTYVWNTSETSSTINNLPIGTYTVTVTDANDCTTVCSATVDEAEPIVVISTSTPLACHGDSTSSADFIIEGGTAPYTYIWDNGSTDAVIYDLSAGFYGITVTDAKGCIGICGTWVEGPEPIEVVFENSNISCFGNNDGAIFSTVTGGTGAYTFLWSTGANTQNQSGLAAGTYDLTISDENGCTQIFTTTIASNPPLEAICTPTAVSCINAQDGNILVDVNGGSGTYTFVWNNGATTQHLFNVSPGTYSLTITDENGCSTTCSTTVESPAPISLLCSPQALVCADAPTGSIITQVYGGTPPYTYQWSTGATTQNLENLDSGMYTITVTDANGCSNSCTATVQSSLPLSLTTEGQDLICGAANSGIAAALVEGGTPPYTYAWSNGAATPQINDLEAGTYDLTVTDHKGCMANTSITIHAIPALSIICYGQDLLCGDVNSGKIETTISGGTAPYSYLWSNGAITENLESLSEGTYTLTVTDANACTVSCSTTLTYVEPMIATCSSSDLLCASPGTGSIDLDVSGGTAPYIYLWSNGANTQNLDNLDVGTYTVTIFDANGCVAISNCEVVSDLPLAIDCMVIGATCGDDHSGDIDVEISGGTAPYTFEWSNGASAEDLIDVLSGSYSVTVSDAKGCSVTCTSIVETSLGLNLSVSTEGTQCGEEGTGSVDLTVTGGTGNYSYSWSNGTSAEDLSNVDSGPYSVTVTDNNGCSNIATAMVEESTSLEAVCEPNNIPCGGEQTGSIDLTVIGGTGPYGFQWSNGSVGEDLNNIGAGTYTVTITDSEGCSTICSSTVTESPAFTISCISTAVSCKNANDGAVNVSLSGGADPFTYTWSNGASAQNLNNLSAGNYILTVTDANGCTANCTSIVTEPSTLIVVAQGNDINCYGAADGSAFATAIGGTVPYTYTWSNGASTPFINSLSAGTYTLTVTDANGCSNFGAVTINEPALLELSCNALPQDCQTGVGSISTSLTGGTAPFSYAWSNGSDAPNLEEASPGSYTLTVTDAMGCVIIWSADVAATNLLELTCEATPESCGAPAWGSVDLTVSGGTAPYFYLWSNGMASEDLTDVPAGTYSVTVTDISGCFAVCTSFVEQAPSLDIQLTSQNVLCNAAATGSIQATVSQGTPPLSYFWSNGATTASIDGLTAGSYSLTVVDANGCSGIANTSISQPSKILLIVSANPTSCQDVKNGTAFATTVGGIPPYQYSWSNGMTTSFINTLSAGDYTVTVTDANGCSSVGTTTVEAPAAIQISFTSSTLNCGSDIDGSINAIVSGGVAPISYQWSTGATSASIDGIGAGTYGLIVSDANGCTSSAFVDLAAANPIVLECMATDVICYGESNGSAEVHVSGGALPYAYYWNNGATNEKVIDVAAGTYTVTVTDANGCTAICTSIVNEPQPLIVEYGATEVTCNGGNDGTLFAYPIGGTAPYNYEWSTGDQTETVENLPAGAYGLTLTDANGCLFICGIIISEPEAITCSTEVNPAISGTTDLYDISVIASGGMGTFQYSIDGGTTYQNDNVFADLPTGTYPIVLLDDNGCTSNCEAFVGGGAGLWNGDESRTSMAIDPNPAASEMNLAYKTQYQGLTYIEVKNLDGKVLYSEQIYAMPGENKVTLDVSGFPNGTYFLVIYEAGGITSDQFSVLK